MQRRLSGSAETDDAEDAEREQHHAGELAHPEPLAEELLRDDIAEQQLDEAERAHVDGRFEGEAGEP